MSQQANRLDRAGIFKAKPFQWGVRPSKNSKAVSVEIGFLIQAQLEGDTWTPWEGYDDYTVFGWFFIVKKDGGINTTQVEQLSKSLGWNGDLREFQKPAPDTVVQITVKENDFNGEITFKADWINPVDHIPGGGGAAPAEVNQLQSQFGSLLRAAASGAVKANPKPAAPKPAAPKAPAPVAPPTADDIPLKEAGPFGGYVRADALGRILDPKNRDHLKTALADLNVIAAAAADVRALDDATLEKLDERVFDLAIPL